MIQTLFQSVARIAALGGPVVLLLTSLSVLVVAVALYKLWQFQSAGVGRHRAVEQAALAADQGDPQAARAQLAGGRSYLAPVALMALDARIDEGRLTAEAESRFARLEAGFRLLDVIAQLAPLMGLFGTVLGMISAFQALQQAGAQVDPSLLAGGIWVALMTTAVGLAVAMPTSALLSWLESRMDSDRILAQRMIQTLRSPAKRPAQDA